MENLRNGGESDSHWILSTFFDQPSIAIPLLKCFGLERRSSSSSSFSYSSSSSGFLSSSSSSHSEEDEGMVIREEEEDDMTVEITERRLPKGKGKEPPSSGKPGKRN